jgi:hypothetical protein
MKAYGGEWINIINFYLNNYVGRPFHDENNLTKNMCFERPPCGLVVRATDPEIPGSIPGPTRFSKKERGPLRLVRIIEEVAAPV